MMNASVYWVRHKDHTNIFVDGYVGVSKNPKTRWEQHKSNLQKLKHENLHFQSAFLKYGIENLIFEIVCFANEKYCYQVENKLRSKLNVGWNIAIGGEKPPVSKFRGEDYKSPLKGKNRNTPWLVGKKLTKEQKLKLKEIKNKKIKYKNTIFNSFQDLAKHLNLKYSTLTNRIYRNSEKWGYEVIK
jgi:predicted GIY-YIG superfamily endonuclease